MWRVQHHDDTIAFGRLVERWQTPIQQLCARMTGDLHRGEDLAQETFTRVFIHRHDYKPSGKFSTWLWQIALNLCRDDLRKRYRHPESPWPDSTEENAGESVLSPQDSVPSPDAVVDDLERAELVRLAVARLPESYRAVVLLRHFEGLKFAEIAEVLGIPEGTVKSRMVEGLNRLAPHLSCLRNP